MRKVATILMTSLMTLNLTAMQIHADEMKQILPQEEQGLKGGQVATKEGQQNEENHAKVGERPMLQSERIAVQELRAQKASEEKNGKKFEEKTPAQQMAPKTKVGVNFTKDSSAQAYYDYSTTHLGAFHNASYFSFTHDSITLEDGSVWIIYSGDRYKTLSWFTSDSIVILPNDALFAIYKYKMVNQNTGDTIEVDMTLGPIKYGIFTYYITTIDKFSGYLFLNDGSYWRTSAFDTSITDKWLPGDTIIIGVNNGFLHLTNPNILINVNMDNYATGECLY